MLFTLGLVIGKLALLALLAYASVRLTQACMRKWF